MKINMEVSCKAPECFNTTHNNPDVKLFPFPDDEQRCRIWIMNTKNRQLYVFSNSKALLHHLHKTAYLCSRHFHSSQLTKDGQSLVPDAIPTIFHYQNGLVRSVPFMIKSDKLLTPQHVEKDNLYNIVVPDFKGICRVCGEQGVHMIPIFVGIGAVRNIKNMINSLLPIKVSVDESNFPRNICELCTTRLVEWEKYTQTCAKTDQKFRSMLSDNLKKTNEAEKEMETVDVFDSGVLESDAGFLGGDADESTAQETNETGDALSGSDSSPKEPDLAEGGHSDCQNTKFISDHDYCTPNSLAREESRTDLTDNEKEQNSATISSETMLSEIQSEDAVLTDTPNGTLKETINNEESVLRKADLNEDRFNDVLLLVETVKGEIIEPAPFELSLAAVEDGSVEGSQDSSNKKENVKLSIGEILKRCSLNGLRQRYQRAHPLATGRLLDFSNYDRLDSFIIRKQFKVKISPVEKESKKGKSEDSHLLKVNRESKIKVRMCLDEKNKKIRELFLEKFDARVARVPRSHSCEYCPTRQMTADRYTRHLKTVHPDKPLACPVCNYVFKEDYNLEIHLEVTTCGKRAEICKKQHENNTAPPIETIQTIDGTSIHLLFINGDSQTAMCKNQPVDHQSYKLTTGNSQTETWNDQQASKLMMENTETEMCLDQPIDRQASKLTTDNNHTEICEELPVNHHVKQYKPSILRKINSRADVVSVANNFLIVNKKRNTEFNRSKKVSNIQGNANEGNCDVSAADLKTTEITTPKTQNNWPSLEITVETWKPSKIEGLHYFEPCAIILDELYRFSSPMKYNIISAIRKAMGMNVLMPVELMSFASTLMLDMAKIASTNLALRSRNHKLRTPLVNRESSLENIKDPEMRNLWIKEMQIRERRELEKRMRKMLDKKVEISPVQCDCGFQAKNRRIYMRHRRHEHTERKCKYCESVFLSLKKLKRHENMHRRENLLRCEPCNKSFENKLLFDRHNLIKHNIGEYIKCDECEKRFETKSSFRSHKKNVHFPGVTQHLCPHCGLLYKTRTSLLTHIRMKHLNNMKKTHECSECHKMFYAKSKLKAHYARHFQENYTVACPVCNKMFVDQSSMNKHKEAVHDGSVPHAFCNICGKGFTKVYKLSMHLKDVHWSDINAGCELLFPCLLCNLVLENGAKLKEHMRSHSEDEKVLSVKGTQRGRLICKFCNLHLTNRRDLAIHTFFYHDEIPFICPFNGCVSQLWSKAAYDKHRYTQHRSPFSCPTCSQNFQSIRQTRIHIKMVHGGSISANPYKAPAGSRFHMCEQCGKMFRSAYTLDQHTVVHSDQKNYKCNICSKRFKLPQILTKHYLWHERNTNILNNTEVEENTNVFLLDMEEALSQNTVLFSCSDCNLMYLSQEDLELHFQLSHNNREINYDMPKLDLD